MVQHPAPSHNSTRTTPRSAASSPCGSPPAPSRAPCRRRSRPTPSDRRRPPAPARAESGAHPFTTFAARLICAEAIRRVQLWPAPRGSDRGRRPPLLHAPIQSSIDGSIVAARSGASRFHCFPSKSGSALAPPSPSALSAPMIHIATAQINARLVDAEEPSSSAQQLAGPPRRPRASRPVFIDSSTSSSRATRRQQWYWRRSSSMTSASICLEEPEDAEPRATAACAPDHAAARALRRSADMLDVEPCDRGLLFSSSCLPLRELDSPGVFHAPCPCQVQGPGGARFPRRSRRPRACLCQWHDFHQLGPS